MILVVTEAHGGAPVLSPSSLGACCSTSMLLVTLVSLLAEEKVNGRPHLSASRLLERRKEFNRNLVNIVKQHHKVRIPPSSTPLCWGMGSRRFQEKRVAGVGWCPG